MLVGVVCFVGSAEGKFAPRPCIGETTWEGVADRCIFFLVFFILLFLDVIFHFKFSTQFKIRNMHSQRNFSTMQLYLFYIKYFVHLFRQKYQDVKTIWYF